MGIASIAEKKNYISCQSTQDMYLFFSAMSVTFIPSSAHESQYTVHTQLIEFRLPITNFQFKV